jgi:hypothetical protein
VVEDGLGTDAEEQQEKKQQLEYEEAMKLLELLQVLSHRTYHSISFSPSLDVKLSLPLSRTPPFSLIPSLYVVHLRGGFRPPLFQNNIYILIFNFAYGHMSRF